jgi:hypothetical protein
VSTNDADITECNLGTEKDPKYVKLSRNLSREERVEYVKLLKEFADLFTWTYKDIQNYDTNIIENKIPLKEETKHFRQKLRKINPMLLPVMEKEVKNLLDEKNIVPLRYSKWLANLAPVRKRNGEIRLCVNLWNLNRSSKNDNYLLPRWSIYYRG